MRKNRSAVIKTEGWEGGILTISRKMLNKLDLSTKAATLHANTVR